MVGVNKQTPSSETQSNNMTYLFLSLLGFFVGTIGTLVGAGGGFILMPVLTLLYPGEKPETLTSMSLAVVAINAISGSIAYARLGRIEYKAGLIFSLAALPGAIVGAVATAYLPVQFFNVLLGFLILCGAGLLAFNDVVKATKKERFPGNSIVKIKDSHGQDYIFSYDLKIGIIVSVLVGLISSLLGIGGGIFHVPSLVLLLNFPIGIATATSHFVLAIVASGGTIVHILSGTYSHGIYRTIALSLGVLLGAQLGAKLSHKIKSHNILRILSGALFFVGLRILWMALSN